MEVVKNVLYFTVVFLLVAEVVVAESRIAFVVGNSNYKEVSKLSNPRNDAGDVGARLTDLGFTLHGGKVHYDLPKRSFLREYNRFSQAAKGTEIAFIYFAGHGMQFNGAPHVLPIDIPDDDLNIVQSDAVSLDALLNQINGKADLTIAVFDACREIPNYKRQIQRATRGGSDAPWRGLSRPKVKLSSSLIAYSGGSGELVADGNGRNSPYTELLLKYLEAERIQKERLDVRDVFSLVSYEFRQRHSGQSPELINQGVRPNQYYLARLPSNQQSTPDTGTASQIESLLWQSVERGNTIDEYEAFLDQFPSSAFSGLARSRIARLERSLPLPTREPEPEPQPAPQPVATPTGRLTVSVKPSDARVRIMNIKPRYRDGIELDLKGEYDVFVTKNGYQSWRRKVLLTERDQVIAVVLEKRSMPQRRSVSEPEMVEIPGGRYTMGSPSSERGRDDDEGRHEVRVSGFNISKYETTFEQYDAFAEATGRKLPSDSGWGRGSRPVISVSWHDATAYAEWLSKQTGKRYRLPTEAEWEYAARSGSSSAYSWGDQIGRNRANCSGCGSRWDGKQTAPVGQFAGNAWGVHDMHGNVREWTCSDYEKPYNGAESRCEPASSDVDRALRGGSLVNNSRNARAANRGSSRPHYASNDRGFRVAQD